MPLLVEIMGPAAAGKTTLVQTLCAEDAGIRAGLGLRKAAYVGPLFRKLVVFLPVWALHYRRDRWLDRREMRSIARLETWSRALERPITHTDVAVFDHGPLYRLGTVAGVRTGADPEPIVRSMVAPLVRSLARGLGHGRAARGLG